MTLDEFNEKWKWQLIKSYPGMTIDEPDAIACLDKEFTKLHEQFPFFRYSIIFKKAGSAVVNIHKVFPEHVDAITNILNKSLK